MSQLVRGKIGGREATIAYLTELGGELTTPAEANVVVARYDDGTMRYFLADAEPRTAVGNGNNQYKQDNPTKNADRATRAAKSYKPATAAKQRKAEANEGKLAKAIKGKTTTGNAPVDTTFEVNGRTHGIEVKTIIEAKNDKVTMHPESRRRKLSWARKNKAKLHTVVYDQRNGRNRVYYQSGVGSFRLTSMVNIRSYTHLRELLGR